MKGFISFGFLDKIGEGFRKDIDKAKKCYKKSSLQGKYDNNIDIQVHIYRY